ncbi:MAG: hypothetical protein SF028_10115 [Candidatus Sumerlaeia bacterium]|nr:hypothetical protein [Candidatus Sumerlaeia bacterium]
MATHCIALHPPTARPAPVLTLRLESGGLVVVPPGARIDVLSGTVWLSHDGRDIILGAGAGWTHPGTGGKALAGPPAGGSEVRLGSADES